jgi:hypothetical protein
VFLDVIRAAPAAVILVIGFIGIPLVFGPILLILFAIPVLFLIALL